jgi:hypothetical protein
MSKLSYSWVCQLTFVPPCRYSKSLAVLCFTKLIGQSLNPRISSPVKPWFESATLVYVTRVRLSYRNYYLLLSGYLIDLHALKGDWPLDTKLPLVGGHEGVGTIVAIGPGSSTERKVGERVGIKWLADSCLDCEVCRDGEEATCSKALCSG